MINRRNVTAALMALSSPFPSFGQDDTKYPARPVRIVIPYPPGGSTDTVTRLVGQKLTELWGQPMIMDNKPGADTLIASDIVAKASPDGYTLGIVTPSLAVNKTLYPKAPYDALKDFTAVALLSGSLCALVVNPKLKVSTFDDFLKLAKKGKLSYSASSSIGYIKTEQFLKRLGVKALHVPYKGSAPAVMALIAGEVDFILDTVLVMKPHMQAGRLKGIAMLRSQRWPELPQMQAMQENGIDDFDMTVYAGLIGPAGLPREVIAKINRDVNAILGLPEIRNRLQALDAIPMATTSEAFSVQIRSDVTYYAETILASGIPINK